MLLFGCVTGVTQGAIAGRGAVSSCASKCELVTSCIEIKSSIPFCNFFEAVDARGGELVAFVESNLVGD
eukprot:360083-Pleurochrysis_carterae.AAC.1